MKLSLRCICASLLCGVLIAPMTGHAQDKSQFRDQAKTLEAQLRGLGEPSDRCSLGAYVGDGPIVVRTFGASHLKPGDKLLVVNRTQVAGKKAEDVITVLRGIAPSAVVPLTLDRHGEIVDTDVQCVNARPTN